LQITSVQVTWAVPADFRGVQVYILVENTGQQSVRAFTTRRDLNSPTDPKACLTSPVLRDLGLRPGQKKGMSSWQSATNSDPAPSVWLDFVEFTDGTRWGADECQTAEWLDGWKLGTSMQRDKLLEILREKGADKLIAFIREQRRVDPEATGSRRLPISLEIPPGHPPLWKKGVTDAADMLIQKVVDAHRRGGVAEIERVLAGAVDLPEKN